jgi:hypothetical protein
MPNSADRKVINNFVVSIDKDYENVDDFEGGGASLRRDRASRNAVVGAIQGYYPEPWVFIRHLSSCDGWRKLCQDRPTMEKTHNITIRLLDNADGKTPVGSIQLLTCHLVSLAYRTVRDPVNQSIRVEEMLTVQPESTKF